MESENLSKSDYELFRDSPFAMLKLDERGRIAWASQALSELIGLPTSQLLGHSRSTLPSPAHRVLLDESRLLHLEGPGAPERWLRCDVRRTGRDNQARFYFYQDVSREMALERDNTVLSQQLDNLRQTDDLTGLPNGRAILTQLDTHISRSRRYKNALSVIVVELSVTRDTGTPDKAVLAPAARAVAQCLRERLRWVDQIARWGDREFLIVLPETPESDTRVLATKLTQDHGDITLPEVFADHRVLLRAACASWRPGDDSAALADRAQQSLAGQTQPA